MECKYPGANKWQTHNPTDLLCAVAITLLGVCHLFQPSFLPAIALIFECHEHTVRATLRRWENLGLGGLWEAVGRGAKPKWQEADLAYLEHCLEVESRTYNSLQLSEKLAQYRNVQLSPDRLRRLLKKTGGDGNAPVIVIKENKTQRNDSANKQT